jgi:hypothetical protein
MKNKLNNIHKHSIAFGLLCILFSCKTNTKPVTPATILEIASPKHEGFTKVIVINHTVDGCNWMLKLENGKLLEPVNLGDEFKKENLIIWIQYKHYENYSFCMAGEMVTITSVEKDE